MVWIDGACSFLLGGEMVAGGRLQCILEVSGSGGKELGPGLPTEDVDRKVPSVDHRPAIVRLPL